VETYRKIVRASWKQGKKHAGLQLSVDDVRALAGLPIVQALAQAEALAFCLRTKHRKQRDGMCSCKRGW
jgi:hypothetical protein